MKIVLFFINMTILIIGSTFTAIGVTRSANTGFINDLKDESVVENFIIAGGVILLSTALLGIVVAVTDFKLLFLVYGILLFINHLLQYGLTVITFIDALKMTDYITGPFVEKFKKYNVNNSDDPTVKEVDMIQQQWECCGIKYVTHWKSNPPPSCCQDEIGRNEKCKRGKSFTADCRKLAHHVLQRSLRIVGGLSVIFACIEVSAAFYLTFFIATVFSFSCLCGVFLPQVKAKANFKNYFFYTRFN